jgi:hypothetical protein
VGKTTWQRRRATHLPVGGHKLGPPSTGLVVRSRRWTMDMTVTRSLGCCMARAMASPLRVKNTTGNYPLTVEPRRSRLRPLCVREH